MKLNGLTLAAATVAMLGLAACGTNPNDRALGGAGLGAGAGAAIGAVTGGSVVGGALLGAAGGAAAGYLTDSDKINLGKPAWDR
jgi:osmotically inducible lipoprotein OsmB